MKAQCSSRKTDRKSLREILVKAHAGPLQAACLDEVALVLVENAEMLLFCLDYESSFPTRGLGCRSVAHRDLAAARRNWLPAAKAPGGVNPPDSPCPTHLGLGERVSQNGYVYTGSQTHTHTHPEAPQMYIGSMMMVMMMMMSMTHTYIH